MNESFLLQARARAMRNLSVYIVSVMMNRFLQKSEDEVKILELLMRETLPQRNYFKASEVSDLLKIKPHEMRYWESEFPQVRPQKTRTGQRIYRRHDLVLFSAIKHLLLEKKLSLAAAQRIIAESDDLFSNPQKADEELKNEFVDENNDEALVLEKIGDDQILQEAADLLDDEEEDDEFNEITQQIYQHCAEDLLAQSPPKETVPEVFVDDFLPTEDPQSREDYEKTLSTLKESKASLTEILFMLDKYNETNFWRGFKG